MSQEDDKLDALWHRASAEDAGRPAARTRAAIMAEAAAAARRRAPAANAPRYWMRRVAGVAVVGLGLVLWRQTDVQLPGERPVAAPVMQEMAREAGGEGAAAVESDAAAVADADASTQLQQARPQAPAATANGAAPPPAGSEAFSAIAPLSASAPDGATLLREHFPAQNASRQGHRLWVVLDQAGKVVLAGELAADQQLESLDADIRRQTGREPTAWRIEYPANQQDQRIEMGIMRLAR
jgi:hypothetical protein